MQQLLGSGGLQPLVALLDSLSATCQEQALRAVADFCGSDNGAHQQQSLRRAQPNNIWLAMLGFQTKHSRVTEPEKDLLSARQQVAAFGGLQHLISLLNSSVVCQEQAAHSLADICSNTSGTPHLPHQALVLKGVPPLVRLLDSSSVSCQRQAARALTFAAVSAWHS